MKYPISILFILLFVSCNLPQAGTNEYANSPDPVLFTSTSPAAIIPESAIKESPTAASPTASPHPCDPIIVDYCITAGHFILQRPIQPPGNDKIDLSYPYASTQSGQRDAHHGVEFQNAFGAPVHAAADGIVAYADTDEAVKFSPWTNFYGNVIVIRHAEEMFTLYAHLSKILVRVGDEVKAGDVIGNVGQSGGATGPHLHFEVRKGGDYTAYFSTENPELWLVPQEGSGAISITLITRQVENYEHPLVITRLADGTDESLFTYYLKSYARGFEHNAEDAVLNNLPAGRYKIALNDTSGLKERFVFVEAGKLTEVIFDLK